MRRSHRMRPIPRRWIPPLRLDRPILHANVTLEVHPSSTPVPLSGVHQTEHPRLPRTAQSHMWIKWWMEEYQTAEGQASSQGPRHARAPTED